MIPKIIHYCWFGNGKKTVDIINYIDGWKKTLPDYQIIEWNESNVDLNECDFIKTAYNQKKWAFVSDYVRLKKLNDFGGIYLDTDIEVIKNFDDLLNHDGFLGFMYNCALGTAVIGSIKGSSFTKDLLDIYINNKVEIGIPNNILITSYFKRELDIKLNNKRVVKNNILFLEKEKFEQPSFFKKKGYTIHHYMNSWNEKTSTSKVKGKRKCIPLFLSCILNEHKYFYFRRQYLSYKDARTNKLYDIFR